MNSKFVGYYMGMADLTSKLSYAKRLQVGAVIVKGHQVIGTGYNGTPSGWDNSCEHKIYPNQLMGDYQRRPDEFEAMFPYRDSETEGDSSRFYLKTKAEVLHAESNAIAKVARSTESSEGATLFCTHAPCLECAKLIYQAGIRRVYYRDTYRSDEGLKFLKTGNVDVHRYNPDE